jgi:hypothetical protein
MNGSIQLRLFPDPKPLVENLGVQFFRTLSEAPGVYFMKDSEDKIVYVGKAKNLKKSLNSYRVANPDRMNRRLLRLLSSVRKVECQECHSESEALSLEAELLLALKPRYNRAGTWAAVPRFILFKCDADTLELKIDDAKIDGWYAGGPFNSNVYRLYATIVRLIHVSLRNLQFSKMPMGWFAGVYPETVVFPLVQGTPVELQKHLELLFKGDPELFCIWVRDRTKRLEQLFDGFVLAEQLKVICELSLKMKKRVNSVS